MGLSEGDPDIDKLLALPVAFNRHFQAKKNRNPKGFRSGLLL
jgi:hypothetical protein